MIFCKQFCMPSLSAALILAWVSPAVAQPAYPYPSPYPSVYAPYAGPGGYMAGQAQVINAYGGFQQQQQQAQITNQQALQEQIKTKKMEFDWKQYEGANTPTWTQMAENDKKWKEYRILTNPTDGEIANGDALNVLLPFLQNMANKGVPGIPVPVDQVALSKVNVVAPFTAGNAGLLKDGGNVVFPFMLKGPTQKKLSDELPQAVSMCIAGTLDFQFYKQVKSDLYQLVDENKKKFHQEEIDGGTYLIAKRFLDDLESAVILLQDPNAAKFLNGTLRAKGSTVPEVVYSMIKQGLKFAPATTGDESAYTSVYNSMVTFAMAAQNGSGFQVQMGPGHQQGFQKSPPK